MKKLTAMLLAVCLLFTMPGNSVDVNAASALKLTYGGKTVNYTDKQLKATCNGKRVSMTKTPGILEDGTALLPYATTFRDALGVKTSVDKKKKTITMTYGSNKIVYTLNSKTALVNGKKKTASAAPKLVIYQNSGISRHVVPSRFTAENLGIEYSYNSGTAMVTMASEDINTSSTSGFKIQYGGKTYNYTKKTTAVTVNGKKISSDMPGLIINNTTLVPVYDTFAKSALNVTYSKSGSTVTLSNDTKSITMTKGSKTAYINRNKKTMPEAMWVIKRLDTGDSRIMVPGSFVSEALGYQYTWNNSTVTAAIVGTPVGDEDTEGTEDPELPAADQERKAMWISYLEIKKTKKTEAQYQAMVDEMFDNCVDLGMNTVIFHVRPYADAMYESDYFPWSAYASGTQGTDPGYDPLKYAIEAAHDRNLRFEAWLNPYRVTLSSTSASSLAKGSIAREWMESSDKDEKRNVLSYNGNLYFNPAKTEVQQLIVNGVKEIVKNYDVDAIHLDDYFYPSFSSANVNTAFDAAEYKASGTTKTIAAWRRDNVDKLVQGIYKGIKAIDQKVEFGISPAGNIDNLTSSYQHYVNIEKWMSTTGYVDYIMPQIYWGFENGQYSYDKVLDRWVKLKTNDKVKLYVGIANYKAGTSDTTEWKNNNDILKRQIEYGRETEEVDGYAFFSYSYFYMDRAAKETANLLKVLNKK